MIPLIPVALGALGGALTSKDPLKGALLGGGMGAAGGLLTPMLSSALAPSALSAGTQAALGPTGVTAGSQQAQMLAAQEAGMGGGLLDQFKTAAGYTQPFMQAAQSAQAVKGLLSTPEMQAPQMAPMQGSGAQTLAALSQAGEQQIGQMADADMKRRMMNQQIIQQMLGRNYG